MKNIKKNKCFLIDLRISSKGNVDILIMKMTIKKSVETILWGEIWRLIICFDELSEMIMPINIAGLSIKGQNYMSLLVCVCMRSGRIE